MDFLLEPAEMVDLVWANKKPSSRSLKDLAVLADVHLGWEQMMHIVDPTTALEAKQKSEEFNRKYGAAIRNLREEKRLKQAAIDGLTERHLRRIEQGKQAVTSSALRALAKAYAMQIENYLKEVGRRV